MKVTQEEGARPIKAWTDDIEPEAMQQARNIARLPFIAPNGVALMPDVHAGIGSTVGTVIATDRAVVPAAVGVDIGCGMNAVRTSLKASDLPESLKDIRNQIERDVPLGPGGRHQRDSVTDDNWRNRESLMSRFAKIDGPDVKQSTMAAQLGSLGSGNHFIELCLDEKQDVWVMLHSGSRGTGNRIGMHFIEKARREAERWMIALPHQDLAYLPEGSEHFDAYMAAVDWAQEYALENRAVMMDAVLAALRRHIPKDFTLTTEAVNCHHNYVEKESHFGKNLWITRKGAIRAREGDLGIIPGSMGQRSYIVRGKGNPESYCSCSHGAGRRMSRTQARKQFTVDDLIAQTEGVECRKDGSVLDEIPSSYKDIAVVMEQSKDLVDVVHILKQVLCVKGG